MLEALRAGPPARAAYTGSAGTLELTHLVADRPELVERLNTVLLASFWRMLAGARAFTP